MNLRQKFIWNIVLVISFIILGWNSWNQYNKHVKIKNASLKYKNEKVGTDQELQNMVAGLEKNINERQTLKFKIKEDPLDLTKVINVDGDIASGNKGIDCKGAWSNENESYATCYYKQQRFEVTKGDSIGGGLVTDVTATKVFIEKNDEIIKFYFGLDKFGDN